MPMLPQFFKWPGRRAYTVNGIDLADKASYYLINMGVKDTFKSHFWQFRMSFIIILLGILSASFLYLIDRNIDSNHQHTMRADILMDVFKTVSQAQVELMHFMRGESVDTGLIEEELSEAGEKIGILLDGGMCDLECPLEPLVDNALRSQAGDKHFAKSG
jgi:hypothetical protein